MLKDTLQITPAEARTFLFSVYYINRIRINIFMNTRGLMRIIIPGRDLYQSAQYVYSVTLDLRVTILKSEDTNQTCHVNNSFLASSKFCNLLITFANRLDSDQALQSIGPDLDPNCLAL